MRRRLFTALAAAAAVTASILITSPASAADPTPALAATNAAPQSAGATPNSAIKDPVHVDEGQFKIVATLRGVGKQVYDCTSDGKGYTFREPIAGLFTSRGIPAAIHGKGPFWASLDGSHVDGSGAQSLPSSDPTRNVPWLKLIGTPTPNTTGLFSNVVVIQRIDTRGGVAPAGGCTFPSTTAVDYTANYVFWASIK